MTLALSDLRDPGPVFTAEYKAQILADDDAVEEPGGKGALLRREGPCS